MHAWQGHAMLLFQTSIRESTRFAFDTMELIGGPRLVKLWKVRAAALLVEGDRREKRQFQVVILPQCEPSLLANQHTWR
jgi:hypothetical protein